jgi:GTP cyclohydrolase FolE2
LLPARTIAFTLCPCATSSWTRFEPMKPEAPVTKHFILLFMLNEVIFILHNAPRNATKSF